MYHINYNKHIPHTCTPFIQYPAPHTKYTYMNTHHTNSTHLENATHIFINNTHYTHTHKK